MSFRNIFSTNTTTANPAATLFASKRQLVAAANESTQDNSRLGQMTEMLQAIGSTYSVPFILFYKGYDYNEIAAKLDIPVGSVKSRIFSARLKMKQMVAARRQAS